MTWSIRTTQSVDPVYFIRLPADYTFLWANNLTDSFPQNFIGDMYGFTNHVPRGTPLIPIDFHHALSMNWVTIDVVVRNMPYLDDTIKAAILLVVNQKEKT